jgi:hypothetical protein
LLDLKDLPRDPDFKRYSSAEFTIGAIDEADEVCKKGFQILSTRVGRKFNDKYGLFPKILMTCNPSKTWLYHDFYALHRDGKLPEHRAFIQSLLTDNPFQESHYRTNLELLESEDDKQRLLYGNWEYEDKPDTLIEYSKLERCFLSYKECGHRSLGADVGTYSGDFSVIAIMDGNSLISITKYRMDIMDFARKVREEAIINLVDADRCAVDGIGVGSGCVSALKEMRFRVYDVQSSLCQVSNKASGAYRFFNLRSQMWWTLREQIKNEEFHIAMPISDKLTQELISDLTSPTFKIKGDKMIMVEAKEDIRKRIGRSPDLGDAVVYANWIRTMRANRLGREQERRISEYNTLESIFCF